MKKMNFDLVERARKFLGYRSGVNDDVISGWLRRFGLVGSYPYCAAFVCSMVLDVAKALGFLPSPLAVQIWKSNPALVVRRPYVGCLAVWSFGDFHGHVGIVEGLGFGSGTFYTIEGNATGLVGAGVGKERSGGLVARKTRAINVGRGSKMKLLGFVDPFLLS
jgi:hypothetical protein